MIWAPERNRVQGELVAAVYQGDTSIPADRRAVVVAGLPGADTAAALASARIDPLRYLTVSLDAIKEEMAARSLIPQVEGLSPMEASGLVHAEAAWIAKRLGLRAIADGRNILWDVTMASRFVIDTWLDVMQAAGYLVSGIFAEISAEESVQRTAARHRRKHEDYTRGIGFGGRYIAAEAIHALAAGAQASPPPARPPLSASDEVRRPIEAYAAGQIPLDDVAAWFRARRWPPVPRPWPPELEQAAAAIDDPEPYIPGSFDDVARAYDLGQLNDADYAVLAGAARGRDQ
jgi:Zeta toxin